MDDDPGCERRDSSRITLKRRPKRGLHCRVELDLVWCSAGTIVKSFLGWLTHEPVRLRCCVESIPIRKKWTRSRGIRPIVLTISWRYK